MPALALGMIQVVQDELGGLNGETNILFVSASAKRLYHSEHSVPKIEEVKNELIIPVYFSDCSLGSRDTLFSRDGAGRLGSCVRDPSGGR